MSNGFLPLSRTELLADGITQPDFVYVSGDAYVDHSSFGTAIICRLLQSRGYSVALICQPDWRDDASIQEYGEPRLGFLVSSGNMDSMVNHYTVAKKRRHQDAYSPGGVIGKRPDYAVIVYCNLIRRTYKHTPIIIGGIICYLLLPVVNRLERLFNRDKEHGWARSVSVLLTFAVIAAAVILVLAMIVISIYKNVGALNIESITNLYTILKEEYAEVAKYLEQVMESFNISSGRISTILKSAAGAIENFFSGLLFGVIFAVYFLLDKKNSIVSYWNRAFRLIFGDKAQKQLRFFMKDADNAFSGYIRGQMVDAAIVGVMASIALAVAGVPYAVLIGVCIGFGNLIPYFGPVVGYAAVVIVCLPTGNFAKMIIGLAIIAVIMFVDGNIINPRLLSENVDVHPLLVVAALLGGGVLGGIAGMLIAVPTAALLKLQFDRYLQKIEDSRETPE